jgi:hypothetical protein
MPRVQTTIHHTWQVAPHVPTQRLFYHISGDKNGELGEGDLVSLHVAEFLLLRWWFRLSRFASKLA